VATPVDVDDSLRSAAFAYLDVLGARDGLVTRSQLEAFTFDGRQLRLIAPRQGIWKPKFLRAPLSIFTTYVGPNEIPPYDDAIGADSYPRYKWRGSDPDAYDNAALRIALAEGKPLMWFIGVAPALFRAEYPVWLVDEESAEQQFVLALDEAMQRGWRSDLVDESPFNPARRYAEAVVRVRLHQRPFRDRVLLAYNSQCSLCRLRHRPLLDAAHIKEDSDGGEPIVPNGVAMCAIHHRAFDANVLGLRPDYVVVIRPDILAEHDGPTLQHALQGLHGQVIGLPRKRAEQPSRELLEERFQRFRAAS
jgi:putative restriction endonuclease